MRQQGERGDHLDQSAEKVYDLNLELDVSTHLHSLTAFFSPTLPFVLSPPPPPTTAHSLSELNVTFHLFSFILSTPSQYSHSLLVSHSSGVFVFPSN